MKTITHIKPFCDLPADMIRELDSRLSYETVEKGTILLTQEITPVDKLYILTKGEARYYFKENFADTLKGTLKKGEHFGGISILMNDGISTRTFEVCDDCEFLTLKASDFINVCNRHEAFRYHFSGEFGKCMLNSSYAGIILRHLRNKEFNLPFFNQPISAIFRPNIATCPIDTPIVEACRKMSRNSASAILIRDKNKKIAGIVTDADLKSKVLAQDLSAQEPVSAIMASPVISISADCQVYDAFLQMTEKDKRHLAVESKSGDITGIITGKDLVSAQTQSTYLLIKTIHAATHIDDLKGFHSRLAELLLDPIKNGSNPEYVTKLITDFSEAILDKIIRFTIDQIGQPPCPFVFIIMGSEGRDEQTLISDQDNAVIFQDLEDEKAALEAKQYFDNFSQLTCAALSTAGYKLCDGDNMAQNPKWCQPLSVWKDYFSKWVRSMDPEKILYSSIFFDFRGAWGDLSISEQLKTFLLQSIEQSTGILRCLTENSLRFKPPLSFFGNIVVEEKGKHKGSFDIKKTLLPIVDFARIYALKNGIDSTNTLTRLFRLYTTHTLTNSEYLDLYRAYNHMMRLRFLRQITTIMDENQEPDNYINPGNLSTLDRAVLKEIFKIIEKLQQKLKLAFLGGG